MEKIKYVPKIAIVGGPGGGKSSLLTKELVQRLTSLGFTPFVIKEAATLLNEFGVSLGNKEAQRAILSTILNFEKVITNYAIDANIKNPIILCDRGALDALAYCEYSYFESLCQDLGTSVSEIRRSYNAVIHLRTTAHGKEKVYLKIKKDNPARNESPEKARELCDKLIDIYSGVKQLHIIGNKTNAKKKTEIAVKKLLHILGHPIPSEIERKFLIDFRYTPKKMKVNSFKIEITQDYLISFKKETERVRMEKFPDDHLVYTHTIKKKIAGFENQENENPITYPIYQKLLKTKDEKKNTIHKHRYKFVYLDQYFELDFFYDEKFGKYLVMLEIELTHKKQKVNLPPWLPIIKEVTSIKKFSNSSIAENLRKRKFTFY